MIKIDISNEKELKILFGVKSYEITEDSKKHIISLYHRLADDISTYLDEKADKNNNPILQRFLKEYILSDEEDCIDDEEDYEDADDHNSGELEKKIRKYLFKKDLEYYIEGFWRIVAKQWMGKTEDDDEVEEMASNLCRISSAEKFYMPDSKGLATKVRKKSLTMVFLANILKSMRVIMPITKKLKKCGR